MLNWIKENIILIIFILILAYKFIKFFYDVIKSIRKENGLEPIDTLPECNALLAEYINLRKNKKWNL